MATKWIILIVIAAAWLIYVVFFNPEDKGGYVRGLGQMFRFGVSIVIMLALAFATALIF